MAKAAVRVTSGSSDTQLPGADRLRAAADLLQDGGFEVLRIGRTGVSIQGEAEAFLRELGVHLGAQEAVVETPKPTRPELAELIDLVEVAPPPISFG